MKDEVQKIVRTLNNADVRYVVAGGLAVVAHGYLRLTMDVDLVIDLDRENLLRGLNALEKAGYQPRLPVTVEQFSNKEIREGWIKEKGMLVFPLWNPVEACSVVIDVFVQYPFDFASEYANAKWMELDDGVQMPFVGLECLLRMKKEAGRPKDLLDIEYLEKTRDEGTNRE